MLVVEQTIEKAFLCIIIPEFCTIHKNRLSQIPKIKHYKSFLSFLNSTAYYKVRLRHQLWRRSLCSIYYILSLPGVLSASVVIYHLSFIFIFIFLKGYTKESHGERLDIEAETNSARLYVGARLLPCAGSIGHNIQKVFFYTHIKNFEASIL
jgi:hypothetical protein